jgi:hypothetical protein
MNACSGKIFKYKIRKKLKNSTTFFCRISISTHPGEFPGFSSTDRAAQRFTAFFKTFWIEHELETGLTLFTNPL